ncbi:hypothetical protein [Shewanella surugensis]|uniref:PIN domain-containing protein n=1 Tax=Shewanella surugensis TaxID=212020 RepID=A0ABT0LGX7_9GAMM|nr:hypothetical protein [Shewanella surugensis]MCL1126948.1 hypothetical protein [Shewanella surugensis]
MNPDPFYGNVYFDSCAFDGGNEVEQEASLKARELFEDNERYVEILHSVAKEIDFPNTPQWVKSESVDLIYTIEVELTQLEIEQLRQVEILVVGNGSIDKMRSDCRHIFEAQKYGRYFVSTDKRILKKSGEIKSNFGLYVIKPSEFLETLEYYVVNRT